MAPLNFEIINIFMTFSGFQIYDSAKKRYEPFLPATDKIAIEKLTADKQYEFIADSFGKKMPGFNVKRVADNTVMYVQDF